jgi:hypothetical protein
MLVVRHGQVRDLPCIFDLLSVATAQKLHLASGACLAWSEEIFRAPVVRPPWEAIMSRTAVLARVQDAPVSAKIDPLRLVLRPGAGEGERDDREHPATTGSGCRNGITVTTSRTTLRTRPASISPRQSSTSADERSLGIAECFSTGSALPGRP